MAALSPAVASRLNLSPRLASPREAVILPGEPRRVLPRHTGGAERAHRPPVGSPQEPEIGAALVQGVARRQRTAYALHGALKDAVRASALVAAEPVPGEPGQALVVLRDFDQLATSEATAAAVTDGTLLAGFCGADYVRAMPVMPEAHALTPATLGTGADADLVEP